MSKGKVILVGVGGATCSGKTTLAKYLNRILPDSVIIHQDDFAPPQEKVPVHPVYKVQDWDAPEGAIEWPRLVKFLHTVKETGEIPPDHKSHDHLNEQRAVPIPPELQDEWTSRFRAIQEDKVGSGKEKLVFGLVDGFLLYWHPEVLESLDVRIFLRVPETTLRQRRHERHGYHTAVQSDPEGSLWRDPPKYWEQIVYPAYVAAHKAMFEGGDVESGAPTKEIQEKNFIIMKGLELSMGRIVDRCCEVLESIAKE